MLSKHVILVVVFLVRLQKSDIIHDFFKSPIDLAHEINRDEDESNVLLSSSSSVETQQRMNSKILLPVSLSMLMNFDQYGTSSVQLVGNDGIFWSDTGTCPHGQTFDPYKFVCRDIFCLDGFVFGPNGCEPDPDKDADGELEEVIEYPEKLLIELTIQHKMCLFIQGLNETEPCTHPCLIDLASSPLDVDAEWMQRLGHEFFDAVAKKVHVNSTRFANFEVISREISHNEVTSQMQDFANNDDAKTKNHNKHAKIRLSEKIRVKFLVKEKEFENDHETLEIYFQLLSYGRSKEPCVMFERRTTLVNIMQAKSDENAGWCEAPDRMETYCDGFRILASFGNLTRYFVYVNATETIYTTGYYYLMILFMTNGHDSLSGPNYRFHRGYYDNYPTRKNNPTSDESDLKPWLIDIKQLNLTDVTEFYISNKTNSLTTYTLLAACDRAPKIRILCTNYTTVRVRICEFIYVPKNRSFCWSNSNKCYSVDEYEFDPEEPDKYLRICNFETVFLGTNNRPTTTQKSIVEEVFFEKLPAWLSFVLTLLSITLMIMCLVTYALFAELRNIPGWNIINLTLALTIAQVAFLSGSCLSGLTTPMPLCFLNSLVVHYGYLASFFWMNVIAFDMYRNFRDKASHVLIHTLALNDRLPKYAAYAWLAPLLVVATALIVDLSMIDNDAAQTGAYASPFRPCYAGYLPGCEIRRIIQTPSTLTPAAAAVSSSSSLTIKPSATILISSSSDETKVPDLSTILNQTSNGACEIKPEVSVLSTANFFKSCWIHNGRANLVFFGMPIAIIIAINGVFYFLTIFNIRQKQRARRKSQMRRFTRAKLPSQVKFYIQMGVIMGFGWISGFLITTTSHTGNEILHLILIYIFLILNSSTGVFIFFAFICKPEVGQLYVKRYRSVFIRADASSSFKNKQKWSSNELNMHNEAACRSYTRKSALATESEVTLEVPSPTISFSDCTDKNTNSLKRSASTSMNTFITDVASVVEISQSLQNGDELKQIVDETTKYDQSEKNDEFKY